jgi:hypothetical protein
LELKLIDGSGEIFGEELCKNKTYKFSKGERFFIFTWNGCTLELDSDVGYDPEDEQDKDPMQIILNIHHYLNELRTIAQ